MFGSDFMLTSVGENHIIVDSNELKTGSKFQYYSCKISKAYSLIEINGDIHFIHTTISNTFTIVNFRTKAKHEFYIAGLEICNIYCPRYVDFSFKDFEDKLSEEYLFDNSLDSEGNEETYDFYTCIQENSQKIIYLDTFFISGKKDNKQEESIFSIDISDFPEIKIVDEHTVKVNYIPLDKSIIFRKEDDVFKYSLITLNNKSKTELHHAILIATISRIKKISNKKLKNKLIDFVKAIDVFTHEKKLGCYEVEYRCFNVDSGKIVDEVHLLTYSTGNKKLLFQVSDKEEQCMYMLTHNGKIVYSGNSTKLNYVLLLGYFYGIV